LIRISEDVHSLAYALHPAILEHLGLIEALKAECDRFSGLEKIPVNLRAQEISEPIPRDVALCFFRITQEALRNVARHAQASSVEVILRCLDGGLQIVIQDNGAGFDPAQHRSASTLGHASMRERVHLLNGELDIESSAGHGTAIMAWVPLQEKRREPSARSAG